ncbi:hypothetical protein ACPOL_3278 [Acidisarcina polymorpha]|uniref:Uncharacterized protein n=1 Tax=Acidisarcina polymorpha TaxID=2211140 RepID=A0A2Z5G088_9BACT|nr:hypothetical protein ACPOL_3278 [Acidisarcina polymorpha]
MISGRFRVWIGPRLWFAETNFNLLSWNCEPGGGLGDWRTLYNEKSR